MLHLITGGSGYFGSVLLRKLRAEGRPCRVFDLSDSDDRPEDVEFVQGDIRDATAVSRACRDVSVIYHNVAQVPLAKDKHLFDSVNIGGTKNLLQAALETRAQRVVYTSSSAVFGVPLENPVRESTPPAPGEAYGMAKWEGEKLCHEYAARGLQVSIIRPRTILGHGRLGIFQILFEWVRTGCNIPVLGTGDNVYQFVHADDLAEACLLAGQQSELVKQVAIYNCGAAQYGTMRDTLQALCDFAQTGSRVKSVPLKPAVWAMRITGSLGLSPLGTYHWLMYGNSMYFDIRKAQLELGWQPRYSNTDMITESYRWYLDNRDEILSARGGSHHRSAVKQGMLKALSWIL